MRVAHIFVCLLIVGASNETKTDVPTAADTHEHHHSEDTREHGHGEDTHEHEHGDDTHDQEVEVTHIDTNNHGNDDDDENYEDDDEKDEVKGTNFQLTPGLPWKEERYTSDWLFSLQYPTLTADVRWFCPFFIVKHAKEPDEKRQRSPSSQCKTVVELKYWDEKNGKSLFLDTYEISYIPTYVLAERNVLQNIKPFLVNEREFGVVVHLNEFSDSKCKKLTYGVGTDSKITSIAVDIPCDGPEYMVVQHKWEWEADNDEDYQIEAQDDERDQDEEDEYDFHKYVERRNIDQIKHDTVKSEHQTIQTEHKNVQVNHNTLDDEPKTDHTAH